MNGLTKSKNYFLNRVQDSRLHKDQSKNEYRKVFIEKSLMD